MASIRVLLEAFVVLISYALCAAEEDCLAKSIKCYECSTLKGDKYCADPFNASHPNAHYENCEGSCAKWVRIPKQGPVHYIRTCSASLNMQMHVSLVCMKESRPGDGHLCFCKSKKCNSANRPGTDIYGAALVVVMAMITVLMTNKKTLDDLVDFVQTINQHVSSHAQNILKRSQYAGRCRPLGRNRKILDPDIDKLCRHPLWSTSDACVGCEPTRSTDALYNDCENPGVTACDLAHETINTAPDSRQGIRPSQTMSVGCPKFCHESKSSSQNYRTPGCCSI